MPRRASPAASRRSCQTLGSAADENGFAMGIGTSHHLWGLRCRCHPWRTCHRVSGILVPSWRRFRRSVFDRGRGISCCTKPQIPRRHARTHSWGSCGVATTGTFLLPRELWGPWGLSADTSANWRDLPWWLGWALCFCAHRQVEGHVMKPNPSIERTCHGGLRPPRPAARVKR